MEKDEEMEMEVIRFDDDIMDDNLGESDPL